MNSTLFRDTKEAQMLAGLLKFLEVSVIQEKHYKIRESETKFHERKSGTKIFSNKQTSAGVVPASLLSQCSLQTLSSLRTVFI